jgi:hypothetical protein
MNDTGGGAVTSPPPASLGIKNINSLRLMAALRETGVRTLN